MQDAENQPTAATAEKGLLPPPPPAKK